MDRRTFLISAVSALLAGCDDLNPAVKRQKIDGSRRKQLVIGITWSWTPVKDRFREGVELAAEQINRDGGVLGRPLRLVFQDDKGVVASARIVAQSFADDPSMIAVIGHRHADIADVVAPVYERAGMLFIVPGPVNPKLTAQGYRQVFRTLPNLDDFGRQLATYAARSNFRNVLIFYARNEFGRALTNSFEFEAQQRGVHVVDRLSYDKAAGLDFRATLMEWIKYYFADALFVVGSQPYVGQIVVQARDVGLELPIFGSPGLVSETLIEIAGDSAEGVVSPGVISLRGGGDEMNAFVTNFTDRYNEVPDAWAAQGFEAIKLLVGAIEKNGTMEPGRIAQTLRQVDGWTGLAGHYQFDQVGNLSGKPILLRQVKERRIVSLPL